MKPTIGRIVHYKWHNGDPDPTVAIITQAYDATGVTHMWLRLFAAGTTEDAAVQVTSENMAAGPREAKEGQWWWPERI